MLVVLTGVAAGSAHVVTGPDHLAALLPLAAGQRGLRLGALWGLGHGLGVLVLALIGRVLGGALELSWLSTAAELLVGVLLIALGLWTLRRSRVLVVHAHAHDHDESEGHQHVHVHVGDRTVGSADHARRGEHDGHEHSAFGFGLLHGSAGGGHLLGVIPSLALGPVDAALYLSAYLLSAVVAMMLFAAFVSRLTRGERHLPRILQLAGAFSVVVGVGWIGALLAG